MTTREQINWYLDRIQLELGERPLRWVLAIVGRLYVTNGKYRG